MTPCTMGKRSTPTARKRERERKLSYGHDAAPASQRRTGPPQASGIRVADADLRRFLDQIMTSTNEKVFIAPGIDWAMESKRLGIAEAELRRLVKAKKSA